MAHTPGPWEAKPTVGRIVLNGSSIYGVADITGEFARWNPDDLVLMAAAPDLLRELKFAVSVLQDNHIARGVAAALAAIRLAEGDNL